MGRIDQKAAVKGFFIGVAVHVLQVAVHRITKKRFDKLFTRWPLTISTASSLAGYLITHTPPPKVQANNQLTHIPSPEGQANNQPGDQNIRNAIPPKQNLPNIAPVSPINLQYEGMLLGDILNAFARQQLEPSACPDWLWPLVTTKDNPFLITCQNLIDMEENQELNSAGLRFLVHAAAQHQPRWCIQTFIGQQAAQNHKGIKVALSAASNALTAKQKADFGHIVATQKGCRYSLQFLPIDVVGPVFKQAFDNGRLALLMQDSYIRALVDTPPAARCLHLRLGLDTCSLTTWADTASQPRFSLLEHLHFDDLCAIAVRTMSCHNKVIDTIRHRLLDQATDLLHFAPKMTHPSAEIEVKAVPLVMKAIDGLSENDWEAHKQRIAGHLAQVFVDRPPLSQLPAGANNESVFAMLPRNVLAQILEYSQSSTFPKTCKLIYNVVRTSPVLLLTCYEGTPHKTPRRKEVIGLARAWVINNLRES